MTHFIFKPVSVLTDPSSLFNFSSANAFLNIISFFYFVMISIFRNMIPKDQLMSWYIYAGIFFVMLSFLLDEDNLPGRPPAGLGPRTDNQEPFSQILHERDIILV